ncbi:hypothetical protein WOLCODRAFT_73015 [Wolfiporia cocos MD-104 SS10]|uniref:CS domain-containing protein n=1 Tax=Wolfiporia cocos (strain MD-104) TaxID=742152 RepID=A0A2H3JJ78_WOLCO|nr:hypothetical protein WOLCODRAFT_73015 [Wolfiporia cocos MD-104 SS10]
MWQLEPRAQRPSARERATSTASSASTPSSYALVSSDLDVSSSFAASLENGLASESDDLPISSPALSSPLSASVDEHAGFTLLTHSQTQNGSQGSSQSAGQGTLRHRSIASPPRHHPRLNLTSSYSSVESLHTASGRLLTLHLEKAESMIWPGLVVGPAPEALAPSMLGAYPWAPADEEAYNMDPTSLMLIALDLYDVRDAREEAFEYFVRAWHQAHVPSATIRLATHYFPAHSDPTSLPPESPAPTVTSPTTPNPTSDAFLPESESPSPVPDTPAYYLARIGGAPGLAQLLLSAGLLHLEGAAAPLLSSAYAGLSSLRAPLTVSGRDGRGYEHTSAGGLTAGGEDAWRRDRACARRYFERVRALAPALDVPLLPPDTSDSEPDVEAESDRVKDRGSGAEPGKRGPPVPAADVPGEKDAQTQTRRRRRKEATDLSSSFVESCRTDPKSDDTYDDRTWYLYIPSLVGAGTALLVVGFLSLSSWRKSQGSS